MTPKADLSAESTSASGEDNKNMETVLSEKRYPWWRCGGVIPQNGRDLGVWEQSLEDKAGCMSIWTLSFLNPLMRLGSRKVLEDDDLGIPSKTIDAELVHRESKAAWDMEVARVAAINEKLRAKYEARLAKCTKEDEKEKVKEPVYKVPDVMTALLRSFGMWRVWLAIFYAVVGALLLFIPIVILNDLVRYFEHYAEFGDDPPYEYIAEPWFEVLGLFLFPCISSAFASHAQVAMVHTGIHFRTGISTLVYNKSLRVSAAAKAATSTGQVVNMMSNDTTQLQRHIQFMGFLTGAPAQIVLALYLIYQQVGNATWVGVGYMLFLAPINVILFAIVAKMRGEVVQYSDGRIKMMNEILTGIRIVKFYAWEKAFGSEVRRLREKELAALTRMAYTSAVGFGIVLLSAPIVQPILVFVTYVAIQSEPLTASTAFTTVALFNLMRLPFAFLPMGFLQYIQAKISLKRIERYLAMPELDQYVEDSPHPDTPAGTLLAQEGSITIKDGTFAWISPDGPEIIPVQEEEQGKLGDGRFMKKLKERREKKRAAKAKALEPINEDVDDNNDDPDGGEAKEETVIRGRITLHNLNVEIEPGTLVAVVGTVGAGKSSFLSTIVGELDGINGSKVYIPRSDDWKGKGGFLSYCSQTPWVINETVKGNILFGRNFNRRRYNQALEACALLDDIAILPAGDATEIGEQGINLSGGQKARVALARAVYSPETKILLMDDPLSAVDAHVGEHLFSRAICGPICRGMTRILVTHHVHVLSRCDKVIVLEDGRIKHQGKYQELLDQGVSFAGAVDVSNVKNEESEKSKNVVEIPDVVEAGTMEDEGIEFEDIYPEEHSKLREAGEKLVEEEGRDQGYISRATYMRYARAGGLCVALTLFAIQAIGRGFEIMATFWLAIWAEEMLEAEESGTPLTRDEVSYYTAIYGAFGVAGVISLGMRGIFLAKHRLHASKAIHDDIAKSILRAPVAFFDVTPVGRILNRFAFDMDKMDLEISQTLSVGISTIFSLIGAIAAIIAATKGLFLIPLIPLTYMYWIIQSWFKKTSTELRRLTSMGNSPIVAGFSQMLSGTATIRGYGVQKDFFEKTKGLFDRMNVAYALDRQASHWLSVRLDIIGGLVAGFVGAGALATLEQGFIPAGYLGLALSYALEMTAYLKFGVQMMTQLEGDMSSVERIFDYADNVEPEAPGEIPDSDPKPGTWPSNGEIQLANASMRYREGPLVLKDLSLTVRGGEKLGVCGRTGSGKSSLMVALFRITELEDDGGKIFIDGINTREVGTSALRLNVSIIPQDPVIFSSTVRFNLDPYETRTDKELWDALKRVRLGPIVAAFPNGLDEVFSEGGGDLSQGQRQLFCIARALVRQPKILVMDEATASIDNETDAIIQEMIRVNFADATILTIAHRLNTIMDNDRILVLDDGNIAELDSPKNLLAKEDGHFKSMVEKSRTAQEQ